MILFAVCCTLPGSYSYCSAQQASRQTAAHSGTGIVKIFYKKIIIFDNVFIPMKSLFLRSDFLKLKLTKLNATFFGRLL
jgi:aromatic ring hydroxylase